MVARAGFAEVPTQEQIAFFENKIRPVLVEQCYECHSATAKKIKGGLVLDLLAGVHKGGDTGPLITPGDPDASLLIEAVRHANDDLSMPPKKKLPPNVIADLEAWVRMGAPDPRDTDTVAAVKAKSAINWDKAREWWSLRPLTAPHPPAVKDLAWAANDVDRFVLARIEEAGLKPAHEADKHALIRRATYDLTGLPPTPQEVADFVADNSGAAFEKVVERLLASSAYGERWGRHWLDVVRYADTAGDNSDYPIPQTHRYRDWVIAAFNRDLPYDEFVRDQLAGDLISDGTDKDRCDRIIATGYIGNARRFGSRVDDYAGTQIFNNDFLPAYHQGVRVIGGAEPITDLDRRTRQKGLQELELGLADVLHSKHLSTRAGDTDLSARIRTFETAFHMQTEAHEAFEVNKESDATLNLYGVKRGDNEGSGWQCIVARRLAERGVRFIEIVDGSSSKNWDDDADMAGHGPKAKRIDQPIAGLLRDLKQRGMLEDTLVVWTTEFGRTPGVDGTKGRGHHSACFSSWMAGGGAKGGAAYGTTDDVGATVVENKVLVHDFHATILHLLGIDHEKLTSRHGGRDYRLTDVFGNVVTELLA